MLKQFYISSMDFEHFIVLDFEATCLEEKRIRPQEIIEFPSVVLDGKTLEEVDRIQIYVKPIHHPQLTKFCTSLTGIEQETVDQAVQFRDAFTQYNAWAEKYPNSIFITCGDWDLKTMLPQQCQLSHLEKPWWYNNWINIKREFASFYNESPKGLGHMTQFLNIGFIGRQHSGIDDCVNIGRVWKKMREDGYIGEGSKYIGRSNTRQNRRQHGTRQGRQQGSWAIAINVTNPWSK